MVCICVMQAPYLNTALSIELGFEAVRARFRAKNQNIWLIGPSVPKLLVFWWYFDQILPREKTGYCYEEV